MNPRIFKIAPASLVFIFLAVSNLISADKWTSLRSANFLLVGNATEQQIRAVAVELEQFRDAVSQSLTLSPRTGVPITVVVYKSEESFRPYKPQSDGKPSAAAGFFFASEDAHYLAMTAGVPIPRSVYHQYIHELMHDVPNSVPLWLTEGLAEFFSDFEMFPKEKQFGVGRMIKEHIDVLRKSPLLSFDTLFAFERSSPQYNEREYKGPYYAESWALVNYLMVGVNGTRQQEIGPFLKLLNEGKPPAESFATAFKIDYKGMLSELDYYVREKATWESRGIALKDKSAIEKEIKMRPLTEAEAEFYTGDLMLHMNYLPQAEPHLKQATTLDPKLAAAQSAMGMILFRQDKTAEAIDYLKRAVTLDPKNYLSQYYYAYTLDKNSSSPLDNLDEKRAALGKAIEVAPQYAPAYELLAYVNLTADIDYNGTIQLLQNAYKLAPGNPNVKFLLAQALVKKQDFDQADKLLQPLVNNSAAEQSIRDGARNLINLMARTRETESRQRDTDAEAARREDEAAARASTARRAADAAAPPPQPAVPEVKTDPAADPSVSATPRGKSGELVAVNPQRPRPEGPQVKGMLTLVDCRGGLTLTVKSATDTVKLHSDAPDKIQFVSYVSSVSTSIACGPAPGQGVPVVITYRPTPGTGMLGEPVVVEFVEK